MIVNPITLSPEHRIDEALELMQKYRISGVPITEGGAKKGGWILERIVDLQFEGQRRSADLCRHDAREPHHGACRHDAGCRPTRTAHKVEKLLVVDRDFKLKGLITVKDIQKQIKYPNASKDALGRLRVGAAAGIVRHTPERAAALVGAHVDVIAIYTAHGHSQGVLDMARIRREHPGIDLIAGTSRPPRRRMRSSSEAWMPSRSASAPGSICTTTVIAGIGVPMIMAVTEVLRAPPRRECSGDC